MRYVCLSKKSEINGQPMMPEDGVERVVGESCLK
ncbi:predicted protein [Botrytis cinerea T4]|uniref:Uncharacterized protein n=1 Tax=Botryotinia fuckeliana (strain T4) TaxID=999810 RepID=G2YH74_BOTF4|nr:predicted protein [Botrytis cinerea T4]